MSDPMRQRTTRAQATRRHRQNAQKTGRRFVQNVKVYDKRKFPLANTLNVCYSHTRKGQTKQNPKADKHSLENVAVNARR